VKGWKSQGTLCALIVLVPAALAQDPVDPVDLTQLKIEDLLNVKVTSVSKREESLARTAAAVFVITQEDIRRSGALNIPDVLRMAPGVDVQSIDANAWAISIRGFNARYSNKVLVLIDGRSVYTPSFSGVFWEQIDMPLENIERIEIIRGPGATVWGANAVNGVISIITKSARDTRGGLATAATGTWLRHQSVAQFGGNLGNTGAWRGFASTMGFGNSGAGASPANDHWDRYHAGARVDYDLSSRDSLMADGDLFDNEAHQIRRSSLIPTPYDSVFREDIDAAGGHLLARWNHTLAGGSETSIQTYFDTFHRVDMATPESDRTFDLDFQHHLTAGRHEIVWGLGYRLYNSALQPGNPVSFSPPSRNESFYSAFFQDQIALTNTLRLTLGSKLEHNPYTGFQTEPGVRLIWAPASGTHAIWASASKAIRQPARSDTSIQVSLYQIPMGENAVQVAGLYGNPHIKNEEARDYEIGYRAEFGESLSVDWTTFLTFYHHLETIEPQALRIIPGSPLEFEIPMVYDNKAHGVDYGAEWTLNWRIHPRWRISPSYSYLHATLRQDPSSQGFMAAGVSTDFPRQIFQFRSFENLPLKLEFDQSFSYTPRLPGTDIPGHARLDLRIARQIGRRIELSLVGQNLLRARTIEYGDAYGVVGTPMVRSVYGKATWRF